MAQPATLGADISQIVDIAREAGQIALGYFRSENRSWHKNGNSPVSEADIAVDRFLREALMAANPDAGWLSEETADTPDRLEQDEVFVVDPIDGTRGFLKGDPNWCISIALVQQNGPRLGVLHCPALERTYWATRGNGAYINGARLKDAGTDTVKRVAGSRRVSDAIERAFPGRFEIAPYLPSLACRLALVASGELDAAFARSGSHEWDVAAAALIIAESGGSVTTHQGDKLRFNSAQIRLPALVASRTGVAGEVRDIAKFGRFLH